MTTLNSLSPEWLSALTDGEPDRAATETGLQNVLQSSDLHCDWNSYQVIGHVLRGVSESSVTLGADPAFLQRLNLSLADEKVASPLQVVPRHVSFALPTQPAANEAVYRWKLVAGFTSLTAALVVVWSFVASPDESQGAQLAQSPTAEQVVVVSPQGPMVRDARLEELMAAHKQLGGSSLQVPSGFLRNAGFDNLQSSRR